MMSMNYLLDKYIYIYTSGTPRLNYNFFENQKNLKSIAFKNLKFNFHCYSLDYKNQSLFQLDGVGCMNRKT
jgi:hypothetical protein